MEDQAAWQARPGAPPAVGRRRLGFLGDGAFKIVLGAGYAIAASPLGRLLGVTVLVMVVTGVLVLACGIAEIRYVNQRPARTYVRLLTSYDTGWVLATLAGLLVAWQGRSAGGEVWMAYQAVAATLLALLVTTRTGASDATGVQR